MMEKIYECEKCGRFYSEEMICPYCLDTMTRSARAKHYIRRLEVESKRLQEQVEYWQLAYKEATGIDIVDKSKSPKTGIRIIAKSEEFA